MGDGVFIGIDFAWRGRRKSSGAAVFRGNRHGAHLVDVAAVRSADVFAYVERHTTRSTIVAIDAPLIICNETGQRHCETLVSRTYGARQASCHSTNLSLYRDAASVRLAAQLASMGFRHAPTLDDLEDKLVMLEVYPHPALLELFGLPSIIKYKKGDVTKRRRGQRDLQCRLGELLHFSPPVKPTARFSELLSTDTNSLRGVALKDNEDMLDAIVCAYIAYHYWFWGRGGSRLFGDVGSGYIIVPGARR